MADDRSLFFFGGEQFESVVEAATVADDGVDGDGVVLSDDGKFEDDAVAGFERVGDDGAKSGFADVAGTSEDLLLHIRLHGDFQARVEEEAGRLAAVLPLDFLDGVARAQDFQGRQHADLAGQFAAHAGDLELLVEGENVEQEHQSEEALEDGAQFSLADHSRAHVWIVLGDDADGEGDADDEHGGPAPPLPALEASEARLRFG